MGKCITQVPTLNAEIGVQFLGIHKQVTNHITRIE